MKAKLEGMCASYELWDSWYGAKQKYNPSNVQTNSQTSPVDLEEEENGDDGDNDKYEEHEQVDDQDGGADGQRDDAEVAASADGELDPPSAQDTGGGNGNVLGGGGEVRLPAVSPAAALPTNRQTQMKSAKAAAQTASEKVTAAISSSPTSTSTKADKFDATYASVQNKKVDAMHSLETMRIQHAVQQQSREQIFQAKTIGWQMHSKEADAKAERRVRQKINYENNLTQLMLKDASAEAIDEYERRVMLHSDVQDRLEDASSARAQEMFQALIAGLAAP